MPETDARRGAVDVARVLALLVVVLGHLTIAVVDRGQDGGVRGSNLLTLLPGLAWLGALAPMPVFFAAGGWANATARPSTTGPRLRLLVGLATVVAGVWGAAVVAATLVAGSPGVLAQGARISTQPLWFLAAYLPFALFGAALASAAARRPALAVGGCLAFVALLDLARFALDGPGWVGWPGFYAVWAVPWLVGGWWRDRAGRLDERVAGLRLIAAAVVAGILLVRLGGYHPSLIDVDPTARSNTTPPNLYTGVAALGQAGLLLVLAGPLDAAARRWRRLWDRLSEAAVAVYVWHLSALSLCAAAISAGLPVPRRLTAAFWLTRPVWWAAVLGVTALLVALTAPLRGVLAGGRRTPSRPPVGGVAFAVAGAVLTGLRGPRSAVLAVSCAALFAAGWWLLSGRPQPLGGQPADRDQLQAADTTPARTGTSRAPTTR